VQEPQNQPTPVKTSTDFLAIAVAGLGAAYQYGAIDTKTAVTGGLIGLGFNLAATGRLDAGSVLALVQQLFPNGLQK
jgi:hypothetical protein